MPRSLATLLCSSFLALLACTGERAPDSAPTDAPTANTSLADASRTEPTRAALLTGRLLLPGEGGRRSVEVHAWDTGPDGEPRKIWILPDDDGSFAQAFEGPLVRVRVHAGVDVMRFDAAELPAQDSFGRVDLGALDLRAQLVERRVRPRAAPGAPGGVVRIGLWVGAGVPRSPYGELPALGSRQFDPIELGDDVAWLLPPDAGPLHFLVERPADSGRGLAWRTGKQQLFGPLDPRAAPFELAID